MSRSFLSRFFLYSTSRLGQFLELAPVVPRGPKKTPPDDPPPSPTGTATCWAPSSCPEMVSKVQGQETRAAQAEPVTKCDRYNIPNCLKVTKYTSSYSGKIHIFRFDVYKSTIQCHEIHSQCRVAVTTIQTKLQLPQKPQFRQLPCPSPGNQHTFISVKVTTQGPSCRWRQEFLPAGSGLFHNKPHPCAMRCLLIVGKSPILWFTSSFLHRHWSCFQCLTTVHDTAVNTGVQTAVQGLAFGSSGSLPRSRTAGSHDNSMFDLAKGATRLFSSLHSQNALTLQFLCILANSCL